MPATNGSSMARGGGTERNPLVGGGGGGGGGGGYGATTDNRNDGGDSHGLRRRRAVGFGETLSLRDKTRRWFAKGGKLEPFRLLKQDMRNLRGRYRGDWSVFNQLVLASAVYVFFTNILPGITFASDLYALTGQSWGTVEVVFSTGLCGVVFSLFSAQPLTILGVTGPFSVLAENLYELSVRHFHVPFLPLMAWSLIHAGWMHVLLAVFNAHDWTMQYVTEFSSDIFSLLNSVIYFHKAYKQLSRIHAAVPFASFLYSVLGAFGTCFTAVFLATAHGWAPLFGRFVRAGLAEYAAALSIMLWIAVPYLGELGTLEHHRLPVQSTSFRPTNPERDYFFVEFWKLPVQWVFVSVIPGAIITVLYYFDHEISSIICTMPRYGVKKPGGYAWDVALLGITTAACGIMGIPPANGLLPQAPLHSESLRYLTEEKYEAGGDGDGDDSNDDDDDLAAAAERRRADSGLSASSSPPLPPAPGPVSFPPPGGAVKRTRLVPRVHEQRYSHFLQAALILCFVSPPFQRLLGLTPTSVLAGLFLFMGYESLSVNPILPRLSYLLAPSSELDGVARLPRGVSWLGVHMYTLTQVVVTLLIFGVTLTVAAPSFPLIIIAFVPIRLAWFGRFWSRETLRYVDAWACRDGKPEDDEVEEEEEEFDGSDDVDDLDDDLNRSAAAGGRDGAGDAVSGRKGHDNLVDLERDAVVTTNARGGGSSNGRSSNGRRRSGHA
ncbi:hypothetical protein RB595_009876 [Gaeumannomyces hyphopodioides]